MTDHIIKAAKDAGWNDLQLGMASPAERNRLARFYAIAFAAGMERAAELCEATIVGDEYATAIINSYADTIRAEAQNQPTGKGEV